MGNHEWELAGLGDGEVRVLAAAAGVSIAPERLPEVTARLRDLAAMLADLEALDLAETAPETSFDPGWERPA